MDKREILTTLEEGRLEQLVEELSDVSELNNIHNVLFHKALELGVLRPDLIKMIDEANYDIAREARLDERELRQMNRKMMADYDPNLALIVYKSQIQVMLVAIHEAHEAEAEGAVTPAANLFNKLSYGQTLSTVHSGTGTPAVAVFTGLAQLEGNKIIYGHISAEEAYENLQTSKTAIFTAVGPSNDPTKYDFVKITCEMISDESEGENLDRLRDEIGPAVHNCLIFQVKEIAMSHLPKMTD